ncbi:BQ2448_1460 [Microbotryum intermedium]|uniref:BQ2448_1460 protein n=1 Tax=Microbotryum intermedium TaxID=269621 RepID=A0A238FGA2_9BASI|nr:BQ2448_1460 [Microbotryum intermedium]
MSFPLFVNVICASVTLKAVATALSIPVARGTVEVEGDLDFRGTLGVDKTAPVGFTAIRVKFDLDCGDTEQEKVEKLISLTERYCVVLQTLSKGVPTSSELVTKSY